MHPLLLHSAERTDFLMMKTMKLGASALELPRVAVGCMRLGDVDRAQADRLLHTALDCGMNFFEHADIYGGGECEKIFADVMHLNDDAREKIFIQSKCGIENRDGRTVSYNFTKPYILQSVDGILRRLKTDYLDVLVLHRPDALMDPAEVADAFDTLLDAGKVRHFGVSNQNSSQMSLLRKHMKMPLVCNQLQLSAAYSPMINAGINVNLMNDAGVVRDGAVLDYCHLNDITVQAWSPFQYGWFEGCFLGNEKFADLTAKMEEIAAKYDVTASTVAIAWLLRHPAGIQPVVGTMNEKRLRDISKATDFTLTHDEWYEIYLAAGNQLP